MAPPPVSVQPGATMQPAAAVPGQPPVMEQGLARSSYVGSLAGLPQMVKSLAGVCRTYIL